MPMQTYTLFVTSMQITKYHSLFLHCYGASPFRATIDGYLQICGLNQPIQLVRKAKITRLYENLP